MACTSPTWRLDLWVGEVTTIPTTPAWEMAHRCRLPQSAPVPTLLLRTPADETSAALVFSGVGSFALVRLYAFPLYILGAIRAQAFKIPYIGALLGVILFGVRWITRSLLSLPVSLVAGSALLLYGYEFVRLAGHVLVWAESAPPGTWNVTYLPPLDRDEYRQVNSSKYNTNLYTDDELVTLEDDLAEIWKQASKGFFSQSGI
jgi:hypothetical protein